MVMMMVMVQSMVMVQGIVVVTVKGQQVLYSRLSKGKFSLYQVERTIV